MQIDGTPLRSMIFAGDDSFAAFAEATSDFVCAASEDGAVSYLNRAGRQHLGLPASADDRPLAVENLIHADDRQLWSRRCAAAIEGAVLAPASIRFRHQDTDAPMALSCQMFRLRCHAHSTTRLAAAAIARLADAAAGAETPSRDTTHPGGTSWLAQVFTGVVGHDLRNPLNAMMTSAHLAMQQSADGAVAATLARILSSGQRMQRMIEQLLDLTRIRAGEGIPIHPAADSITSIAERCLDEVRAQYPACQLRLVVSGDPAGAWDVERIQQLFATLVGNAVQYATAPHTVDVAIDATQANQVAVTVHNPGIIPPDILAVLFNPFRIVHHRRHTSTALGLGLYIGKQIAVAHGGDMTVVSTSQAGTTFCVTLPRAAAIGRSPADATGLGTEDLAVLEMVARAPTETSVTAQLFGAVPLQDRAPQEYWRIYESYTRLLDLALDHQTYKTTGSQLTTELREVAEQLGRLGAGAREVAELHARALRHKTQAVTRAKAQAFTAEGRLVSFELMGHLLSFYRRRSGLGGRT